MRMRLTPILSTLVVAASLAAAGEATATRRFEWTTRSEEARTLLRDLQARIESFQFGPENGALATRIVSADPEFALGHYYVAATANAADGPAAYARARQASAKASDGERRFIEAMRHTVLNQGAEFRKSIPELETLAKDYPDERLIFVVLGQLYNGAGDGDSASVAFRRANAIGPPSPRVDAFLASDELLKGNYAKARAIYADVEKRLPKGSVPFSVRYGTTFSYLYEDKVDEAVGSLEAYLAEYRGSGSNQNFPEMFIHNSIARINLENGRLEAAMKAYERGFESVPGSNLPEDQKKTWEGRLVHGKARTLAKMGRHEEAWALAESVNKMIEAGGQPAEQFWPAYHYLAGYLKLEAGDARAAAEHLERANMSDPFHKLLLGRAYERLGQMDKARAAYTDVVNSKQTGIERALAYPEARRKLAS